MNEDEDDRERVLRSTMLAADELQRDLNLMKPLGLCEVHVGTMFAGKTTLMLQLLQQQQRGKLKRCIVLVPKKSLRGHVGEVADSSVVTQHTHGCIPYEAIAIESLMDVALHAVLDSFDCVFVDEIQFFDRNDLHEFIVFLKYTLKKDAFYFGLNEDKNMKTFVDFNFLELHAKVHFVFGPCCHSDCREEARHTFSFDVGHVGNIRVGTSGYAAVCDLHYLLFKMVIEKKPTLTSCIEDVPE